MRELKSRLEAALSEARRLRAELQDHYDRTLSPAGASYPQAGGQEIGQAGRLTIRTVVS